MFPFYFNCRKGLGTNYHGLLSMWRGHKASVYCLSGGDTNRLFTALTVWAQG